MFFSVLRKAEAIQRRTIERFCRLFTRQELAACAEGDLLRTQLAILWRLARFTPADAVGLNRGVARHAIQLDRYSL
jgi:butyryl-CoA dehydrogenase